MAAPRCLPDRVDDVEQRLTLLEADTAAEEAITQESIRNIEMKYQELNEFVVSLSVIQQRRSSTRIGPIEDAYQAAWLFGTVAFVVVLLLKR